MKTVFMANNDYPGATGSAGTGSYILISQYNFPYEYSNEDEIITQDHDHINNSHGDMLQTACTESFGNGEFGIGQFSRDAMPHNVMRFLKRVLRAEEGINWTGFRVMQTTNKNNGFPVFTLELFANKSGVNVYSGLSGPNINKSKNTSKSFGCNHD
jgi:hypothetical protein